MALIQPSDTDCLTQDQVWPSTTASSLKQKGSGSLKYPNLAICISLLLSLSASNAPVERLFSQLFLMKTDHRNKLKTETIAALIYVKDFLRGFEKKNPDGITYA